MRVVLGQFTRFGLIGVVGLVVDVVVFNVLRATVLSPDIVDHGPLTAKIVSTTIAIVVNWIGNRYWTFRHHRGELVMREGIRFGIVSIAGMLIALACLWLSHYGLGLRSALADNISANGVGLVLGSLFRFWLYRTWVFPTAATSVTPSEREPSEREPSGAPERSIRPAGGTPRLRIQTVSAVNDRATGD